MKQSDFSKIVLLGQLVVVVMLLTAVMLGRDKQSPENALLTRQALAITGPRSAIDERSYHRIDSQEQLGELWREHLRTDDSPDIGVAAVPRIDFDVYEAVAIFDGRSTNTSGVRFVSVDDDGTRRRVRFDIEGYQTRSLSWEGDTHSRGDASTAWGIVVMPRTTLPIVLEENVSIYLPQFGPAVWSEQTRLEPPTP